MKKKLVESKIWWAWSCAQYIQRQNYHLLRWHKSKFYFSLTTTNLKIKSSSCTKLEGEGLVLLLLATQRKIHTVCLKYNHFYCVYVLLSFFPTKQVSLETASSQYTLEIICRKHLLFTCLIIDIKIYMPVTNVSTLFYSASGMMTQPALRWTSISPHSFITKKKVFI